VLLITSFYLTVVVLVDALIHLEHNQQESTLQRANLVSLVLTKYDVNNVGMELIRAVMSA
jgi:hypothetical protein